MINFSTLPPLSGQCTHNTKEEDPKSHDATQVPRTIMYSHLQPSKCNEHPQLCLLHEPASLIAFIRVNMYTTKRETETLAENGQPITEKCEFHFSFSLLFQCAVGKSFSTFLQFPSPMIFLAIPGRTSLDLHSPVSQRIFLASLHVTAAQLKPWFGSRTVHCAVRAVLATGSPGAHDL